MEDGHLWTSVPAPSWLVGQVWGIFHTVLQSVPRGTELQRLMDLTQSLTHTSLALLPSCLMYPITSLYFVESLQPHPAIKQLTTESLSQGLFWGRGWWWYMVTQYTHIWNKSFKKQYLTWHIKLILIFSSPFYSAGHDPQNWFDDPLIGFSLQFENHHSGKWAY